MVNLFRKHQQFLLVVLTITTIIAFVWLYNTPQFERNRRAGGSVANIYGSALNQGDLERDARRINLALQLGFYEYYQGIGGTERGLDINAVFNSIVLQHEARDLQVDATTDEVVDAVKGVKAFETNGSFDPQKYSLFVQNALGPNGLTEVQFEDIVRDTIRFRKMKDLVGSTIDVPPAEVQATLQQRHQKYEASTVTFKLADFAAAVQVGDDDVKRAYEQRKENLKSEETRRVEFVKFDLTGDDTAAVGKERTEALKKLRDRADQFTQDMLAKDAKFADVAAKFAVKTVQTGDFTAHAPDPLLAGSAAAAQLAFKLTPQEPDSDAIRTDKGFLIMHLLNVTPAAQLTLDQAKAGLESQLKNERATEQLGAKAAAVRKSIEDAMKAGKTFADAAQAAGVTAAKVPTFSIDSLTEDTKVPREVLAKVVETPPGRLSDFLPTGDGGFFVCVEKRVPADAATLAKSHDLIAGFLAKSRRELVFAEWLRQRRDAAKPETGPGV